MELKDIKHIINGLDEILKNDKLSQSEINSIQEIKELILEAKTEANVIDVIVRYLSLIKDASTIVKIITEIF